MFTQTALLLIAAAIISLLVAGFQYIFKAKRKSKKTFLFAFLRFLSVFTLLLLIINPKFTITKTSIEKPDLVILADQSASIKHLNQQKALNNTLQQVSENKNLQERFNISVYGFNNEIIDSIQDSNGQQTQIYNSLKNIQKVHRKPNSAIVMLSDGNQTYGSDYSYYKSANNQPIYAVPFGDTTQVEDFSISRVNANKYAYLNNKFPVELLVSYSGNGTRNSQLQVYQDKQLVHKEPLDFSKQKKSSFVNFNIKASTPGSNVYKAQIVPFKGEKNTDNNSQSFVVETIDQKTNVLLVSDIIHPDIAALKRTIESNERRKLTVKKASQVTDLNDYQLLIVYQPKATFKKVYELAAQKEIPLFTITGKQTDWNFINKQNRNYKKSIRSQVEEIIPVLSENFEIFTTDTFNVSKYPPLETRFGTETVTGDYETLLYKQVAGVTTNQPLLAFWKTDTANEAVLFAEGIWKWRMLNYKNNENFENFDNLFGKIIQFLSSKKERKRLTSNYESVYYSNNSIKITADYFNKNFEFNTKGQLTLSIIDTDKNINKKIPMILKGQYYEADLSDLPANQYNFSITVKGTDLKTSGRFSILDFDIEKQFFRPNIESLEILASKNNGHLFYPNQVTDLIANLSSNDILKPIQKSKQDKMPLISWKYLLGVLLLLLGLEWFLRKYNGLI